ncbi:hypothetical protein JCM5350_001739 [Sporobolomyces pararoseus]
MSDSGLVKRVGCKGAFQCRTLRIPPNSVHQCLSNICTYACISGFERSGALCADSASLSSSSSNTPAPSSTSTSSSSTSTSTASSTTTSSPNTAATIIPNAVSLAGVKSFLAKPNINAIASWYHANSAQDSTNGHSWCWFPYNDDTPGFAISLKTMLADFGGDEMAARKAWCGLEAIVTNPSTGQQLTLYVADAFDDRWVLTPTSIDVMYNSFSKLFGRVTTNKNDVVKGATWSLTGNRNARYAFNSIGN